MIKINTYIRYSLRIMMEITIMGLLLSGNANATTFTVCTQGCSYSSIQAAVNASNDGDIIRVLNGIYYENVNVTRQLALHGIGMPVVDARGYGNVITLSVDGILVEGFSEIRAGPSEAGIMVISNNNALNGNHASNNYDGISLDGSSNNTINGNNVSNNVAGISLFASSNNTLSGDNVSNNEFGINLDSSSNNTLSGNNVLNNEFGINLDSSSNNTLSGNNASSNINTGIYLSLSGNNTLNGNVMVGNKANFDVEGNSDPHFINYIDTSNLVDGRPLYYLIGISNSVYDSSINAGTFHCINCVNVTITNLNLSNNYNALFFWNTTNSKIQNVIASNNHAGISIMYSNNNIISDNNVLNNNVFGIVLANSDNNILGGNIASNNEEGIYLSGSNNNIVSRNDFNFNNNFFNNTYNLNIYARILGYPNCLKSN